MTNACHFCGDETPHLLSDCRPDLVQHEPGPLCTWSYREDTLDSHNCYAYQDPFTREWTNDHNHFYPDTITNR